MPDAHIETTTDQTGRPASEALPTVVPPPARMPAPRKPRPRVRSVLLLLADEGDMVQAGQVVAMMDTQDLQASLGNAAAMVLQARKSLEEAQSNLTQQQTQVRLAQQELERTRFLMPKGFATKEVLDQRQQQLDGAMAAQAAATARIGQAKSALTAATHDVRLIQVNIADNTLVAPRQGRIQYRVANLGEVLPAGGKVFTMLDTGYVYMDIYLPTRDAGRIRIGSEARIVLDAYPAVHSLSRRRD